ncbi:hypothetical protein BH23ACT5_BH23ACT5_15510 [soil metagenome]
MSIVSVQRLSPDPVVGPGSAPGYDAVFNAGVTHQDGRFHLFARGVRSGYRRNTGHGPRFLDYRSDVLLFSSEDGIDYIFDRVLAQGSDDGPVWSYEDPRVQWVADGSLCLMTYTDLPPPHTGEPWRIGLHRLVYRKGTFELNRISGRVVGPPGIPNKDAVIFDLKDGRLAMIHRVHPDIQIAYFDSIDDLIDPLPGYWAEHLETLADHVIIRPSPGALGVGAGAPPVSTEAGLLFFYHERDGDGVYTARVILLDPATGRPTGPASGPILVPELSWERFGDVDDVVFVQGAHRLANGDIYLTYGAADRTVGVGVVDEAATLAMLAELRGGFTPLRPWRRPQPDSPLGRSGGQRTAS